MKSLRTRRSTPSSAPQSRPQKQKLSKGNKDARKSRVDDKMKRRMSARYADISDPRNAEVPDMPDLRDLRRIAGTGPTFYDDDEEPLGGAGGGATGEEARVDVLDVRDLEQEDFDPDAYLRSKLGSSTEAELRNFQTSLQTTKDATALDLQKNVFKNYADFVIISKEISTLENDMLELKASLQEWKSMPSLLTLDQSASANDASAAADRRRTARSSIADLRTLYVSQLQTLHSTIEGSATLEREGEHERRRSMWNVGDRKSVEPDAMPALPAWMLDMASGSGAAQAKAEQDAQWINNFTDDLTVAVALQDWDEAVDLMVKGQAKLNMIPGLSSKLNPLTEQLIADLLGAIADPAQRRSSTIKLVSHIMRLGPDALVRARDTFLDARAALMRKRVRAIRFEGDARSYIKELALVVFTSIKHTADWYLASFKDIEMASGLIRWAKGQVEAFAKMFCIQVYGAESNTSEHAEVGDLAIAQECIQAAKTQNRRLLRDIGMDFNFLLLDLISIPVPPEERAAATAPQTAVPELALPEEPGATEDMVPVSAGKPPRPPRSPVPPPPRSRGRDREGSTGR
ncbi:exocyst complex component exo84 [Ceratobasidium sp. 370]|nr:exocyst complex component exo84 [Ceratobasidium sp. 370]